MANSTIKDELTSPNSNYIHRGKGKISFEEKGETFDQFGALGLGMKERCIPPGITAPQQGPEARTVEA